MLYIANKKTSLIIFKILMRKKRDLSWQVDNLLCLINIHFFNNHIINKVFTLFKFQFTRFISKEFYSFKK